MIKAVQPGSGPAEAGGAEIGLPRWQQALLWDLVRQGMPRAALARKYGCTPYRLGRVLEGIGRRYLSGRWGTAEVSAACRGGEE